MMDQDKDDLQLQLLHQRLLIIFKAEKHSFSLSLQEARCLLPFGLFNDDTGKFTCMDIPPDSTARCRNTISQRGLCNGIADLWILITSPSPEDEPRLHAVTASFLCQSKHRGPARQDVLAKKWTTVIEAARQQFLGERSDRRIRELSQQIQELERRICEMLPYAEIGAKMLGYVKTE